jgi:hypothetical protein
MELHEEGVVVQFPDDTIAPHTTFSKHIPSGCSGEDIEAAMAAAGGREQRCAGSAMKRDPGS